MVPYTGGKPKVGFGDLDAEVKRTQTVSPGMLRPLGSSSSAKSQHYRITNNLDEKFQRNGNRIRYERLVMKHFERHGLDTITYLKGPDGDMLSIITDHAKFTLEEAEKAEHDQREFEYDSYDNANVLDAIEYVTATLDDHLEEQIHQVATPDDGFITFWMKLMAIIKSTSIDYYESIKSKIMNLRIANEPGQDVTLLCSKYYQHWKLLDQGGVYDNYLTVHMIKELLKTGTESYRFELIAIKKKLDEKLRHLNNMSYTDSKRELTKDKLDVLNVLEQIKQEYRRLYDDGEWPSASTKRDKNSLSSTYGQVNSALGSDLESTLKRLEANVLQRVQQGLKPTESSTKKKGTCFNCGSPDHWADKCPNRKPSRTPRTHSDKNKSNHKGRGPRSGKYPPPKEGESEVRTDDKGVKHFWCAKCRAWKTTHSTSTHKKKSELPAQAQAHAGLAQAQDANILELASTPYAFALMHQPDHSFTRIPCTISTAKNALLASVILTCALGLHAYVPILLITTLLLMNKHHGTLQHWFKIPSWCEQPNLVTATPLKTHPGRPSRPPFAKRWAPLKTYKPKPRSLKKQHPVHRNQRFQTHPDSQPLCFEVDINGASPTSTPTRILIDSGANVCVTNDPSHFIEPPAPPTSVKTLIGVGKALDIKGYGIVRWTFISSHQPVTVELPCCYIPTSNFCILSTSVLTQSYPDSNITISSDGIQLRMNGPDHAVISVETDPTSRLPLAALVSPLCANVNASTTASHLPNASLLETANYNLTPLQKTLLKWHYRLGHKNFRTIQWMFRHMYLAFTNKDRHTHGLDPELGKWCDDNDTIRIVTHAEANINFNSQTHQDDPRAILLQTMLMEWLTAHGVSLDEQQETMDYSTWPGIENVGTQVNDDDLVTEDYIARKLIHQPEASKGTTKDSRSRRIMVTANFSDSEDDDSSPPIPYDGPNHKTHYLVENRDDKVAAYEHIIHLHGNLELKYSTDANINDYRLLPTKTRIACVLDRYTEIVNYLTEALNKDDANDDDGHDSDNSDTSSPSNKRQKTSDSKSKASGNLKHDDKTDPAFNPEDEAKEDPEDHDLSVGSD